MPCPTLEELESLADRSLQADGRQQIDNHLARCPACRQRVDEVRENLEVVGQIEHVGEVDETPGSGSDETVTSPALLSATGDCAELPRRLGSVRLIREIGHGGMGVVWLGHDEMLAREVAVKFPLGAQPMPDGTSCAEFLDGARAAAALRHPNLVVTYHADIVDNVPYLVMEYIDGDTLHGILKRVGAFQVGPASTILSVVADAVAALHERGIIHRDIKPSNVLLNGDGRVFVTDFGLALKRPVTELGAALASTAGTLPYMAPELFEGQVSARSDVYALGITAFELLTSERPFTGTLEEIQEQQRNQPLPAEALRERRIDEALIEVIGRATHKDVRFRYKNASHFKRALAKTALGTSRDLARLAALVRHVSPKQREDSSLPSTSYHAQLHDLAIERHSGSSQHDGDDVSARLAHRGVTKNCSLVSDHSATDDSSESVPLGQFFPELRRIPAQERLRVIEQLVATPQSSQVFSFLFVVGALVLMPVVLSPVERVLNSVPEPLRVMLILVGYIAGILAAIPLGRFADTVVSGREIRMRLRRYLLDRGCLVCLRCGYDMRGSPSSRCSECGHFLPVIRLVAKLRGIDETGEFLVSVRVDCLNSSEGASMAYRKARDSGLRVTDVVESRQEAGGCPTWPMGVVSISEKAYVSRSVRK